MLLISQNCEKTVDSDKIAAINLCEDEYGHCVNAYTYDFKLVMCLAVYQDKDYAKAVIKRLQERLIFDRCEQIKNKECYGWIFNHEQFSYEKFRRKLEKRAFFRFPEEGESLNSVNKINCNKDSIRINNQ